MYCTFFYTILKYIVVEFKFIQFYKFVEKLELYIIRKIIVINSITN